VGRAKVQEMVWGNQTTNNAKAFYTLVSVQFRGSPDVQFMQEIDEPEIFFRGLREMYKQYINP
jgi:hypothetical protein